MNSTMTPTNYSAMYPTYHAPIVTRHGISAYNATTARLEQYMKCFMYRSMDHAQMVEFTRFQQHKERMSIINHPHTWGYDGETEYACFEVRAFWERYHAKRAAEKAALVKKKAFERPAIFLCADVWCVIQGYSLGDNSDWRRKFNDVVATIDVLSQKNKDLSIDNLEHFEDRPFLTFITYSHYHAPQIPGWVRHRRIQRAKISIAWNHADRWGEYFDWNRGFDFSVYMQYMYPMRTVNNYHHDDEVKSGIYVPTYRQHREHRSLPKCNQTLKARLQRHLTDNGIPIKKSWSIGKLEDMIIKCC